MDVQVAELLGLGSCTQSLLQHSKISTGGSHAMLWIGVVECKVSTQFLSYLFIFGSLFCSSRSKSCKASAFPLSYRTSPVPSRMLKILLLKPITLFRTRFNFSHQSSLFNLIFRPHLLNICCRPSLLILCLLLLWQFPDYSLSSFLCPRLLATLTWESITTKMLS